jgi:hypothetical protein
MVQALGGDQLVKKLAVNVIRYECQGRHDIQHNDTQHNDTKHKGLICDVQHTLYRVTLC